MSTYTSHSDQEKEGVFDKIMNALNNLGEKVTQLTKTVTGSNEDPATTPPPSTYAGGKKSKKSKSKKIAKYTNTRKGKSKKCIKCSKSKKCPRCRKSTRR